VNQPVTFLKPTNSANKQFAGTGNTKICPDFCPPMHSLLLSFAVRPEEIEMAFATNGESLRHRLLLALVAELAIAG
jgi:hypothetical protein